MLNLGEVQALGFDAEEILPQVFYIQNFLTKDEHVELLAEVTSYTEDDWRRRYLDEMIESSREKFGRTDIEALVEEGLLEVTWDFADKNVGVNNINLKNALDYRTTKIFNLMGDFKVTGFLVYQRLYEGSQLKAHFDQYSDKLVEWAAVLYLNDDYTGGELFFPKFDYSFKPAAGSLVLFPGTEEYEHGVHPVTAGPTRYVIPTFIKRIHPDGDMAGWADFG